jgi:hypothetical protein
VWRASLKKYIKMTGADIREPKVERDREEWEIQIEGQ